MNSHPLISFDNTEFAFEYKTHKELRKANFLFSSMSHSWLVNLGIRFTPWAIKTGLPINGLIRNTIFSQFAGGETLEETAVEIVEPRRKSEISEPSKKSAVEEKLALQPKPPRGKWGRRFVMATGVLAILYLAWKYILPFILW